MNFQQLEYALAVHEHHHFARAAESCHVTQATLSAMVKKLEEELRYKLFDRSRKPVRTTDLGYTFMEHARLILKEQEQLLTLNSKEEPLSGLLSIGVIPTVANALLPILLPAILKDYPKLKLTVSEITTNEIKAQLSAGKIDLGILATPIEDEAFEEHILYYEPMMVYGIEGVQKNYVTSADVRNRKIWLLEEGHCFRAQAITICEIREKQLYDSNLNFKGSSFETLLNLADEFGGFTLIPELYFNGMTELQKKRTQHFKAPIPVREISLLSYKRSYENRRIEQLTALIQRLMKGRLSVENYHNKDLEIIGI